MVTTPPKKILQLGNYDVQDSSSHGGYLPIFLPSTTFTKGKNSRFIQLQINIDC